MRAPQHSAQGPRRLPSPWALTLVLTIQLSVDDVLEQREALQDRILDGAGAVRAEVDRLRARPNLMEGVSATHRDGPALGQEEHEAGHRNQVQHQQHFDPSQ